MNVLSIPGDGWHEEEQATIWISNSWKRPQDWWGLDCFWAWQQCVVLVFVQRLGRDWWESESGLSAWCLVLGAWCSCSQIAVRTNRGIVPAAWWRCCCSFWRWTGVLGFLLLRRSAWSLGMEGCKVDDGRWVVCFFLFLFWKLQRFSSRLISCLKVRANKRGNTCTGSTFGCFAANPESGNYELRGVGQIIRSDPSWRQNNGS